MFTVLIVSAIALAALGAALGIRMIHAARPAGIIAIVDADGTISVTLDADPVTVRGPKRTSTVVWPGLTTAVREEIDGLTYIGIEASGAGRHVKALAARSPTGDSYLVRVDTSLPFLVRCEHADVGGATHVSTVRLERGHHELTRPRDE